MLSSFGELLRNRAGGLKPRAAMRLGLSALIPFAVMACAPDGHAESAEFSIRHEAGGLYVITDKRTTCEYLVMRTYVMIPRNDPHGRVTPNCPETGGKYGTVLPGDTVVGG